MKRDYMKPGMRMSEEPVKVLKACKNLQLKEVSGQHVLIPVGEAAERIEGVIRLSDSGRFLWEFLQSKRTLEEMVEAIVREYNIDLPTASEDVRKFVKQMEKLGVLET